MVDRSCRTDGAVQQSHLKANADASRDEDVQGCEGEMECGEGAEEWMLGRVVPNSVSIVGANTAGCVDRSGWRCAGCKGSGHAGWECPGRLYVRFGEACPGFDETGGRRAECWEDGERIGEGTRRAWREYVERHYSPAVRALAEQTGSAFDESGSEDGEGAGDGGDGEMGAGETRAAGGRADCEEDEVMGGGGCEAERGDVVDDGRKAGAGGKEVLEDGAAGVVGSGAEDARRRGEAAAVRTERDVAAGGGRAGADDAAGEVDRSGEGEMECRSEERRVGKECRL